MGSWGLGLLDNDGALDSVGALSRSIWKDIEELVRLPPSGAGAGSLAAAVGLLLQLSPYAFKSAFDATIRAAIERQRPSFGELSPPARALLDAIAGGSGADLASRRGERSEELRRALGGYVNHVREPSLFLHPASAAYTQSFVDQTAASLDASFFADGFDLYETDFLGRLAILLLVRPARVERLRVERWRDRMRIAFARLREENPTSPDIAKFAEYMANVETAFAVALRDIGA